MHELASSYVKTPFPVLLINNIFYLDSRTEHFCIFRCKKPTNAHNHNHNNHHHHQVLLLLVEHRVFMNIFQLIRFPAIPLTSFHNLLVPRISFCIVLRHVLFGLPLLLYPWGFQSKQMLKGVLIILIKLPRRVSAANFHLQGVTLSL
jgi:hypothetical protein